MYRKCTIGISVFLLCIAFSVPVHAEQFDEDFTSTTYIDTSNTDANVNTSGGGSVSLHQLGNGWVKASKSPGSDNVSDNSGSSTDPVFVYDENDNPIMVWLDDTTGSSHAFLARWDGSQWVKMDGTAGYEDLNTSLGITSRPEIAFDSSNKLILVWGGGDDVFLTRWDGTQWSKMDGTSGYDTISNNDGDVDPQLFLDGVGNPTVLWLDNQGATQGVCFSRWNGT